MNILSPIIESEPSNVSAKASVAPANLPPGPKTFSNAAAVSSADTVAPAEKPKNSLTPFSLNKSAALIPADNDLCICSAVVLKSSPVTLATLPVIFMILASSSASSETTLKTPAPFCISSKLNGTWAANLAISSKALPPSSALPNKNFNLTSRFSNSLPVWIKEETVFAKPSPANTLPANAAIFPNERLTPLACLSILPSPR